LYCDGTLGLHSKWLALSSRDFEAYIVAPGVLDCILAL
jgi:hypothetical protein